MAPRFCVPATRRILAADGGAAVRAVVTGATGLIGRELTRQLLVRGDDVIPVSRNGGSLPAGPRVQAVDLERASMPRELLAGVDTLYHLAGVAHQQAREARYQRLNVDATVTLAREALSAGVRTFVFVSSVKAMGPARDERPRDESDLSHCVDAYGASKRAAEAALCELLDGGPMRLVIIRPALVYGGPLRGNLRWMRLAARLGLPRPPERGGRSMIGLADLVDLLCRLPREPWSDDAASSPLIVTDGECYSSQRIYDSMRIAGGRSPRRGRGSLVFWWLAALGLDVLLRQRPGTHFRKLFGWERYTSRRLLALGDWRPRETLESTVGGETGAPR